MLLVSLTYRCCGLRVKATATTEGAREQARETANGTQGVQLLLSTSQKENGAAPPT